MALTLLGLVEDTRIRLADLGGNTGIAPGYYAYWQASDVGCLWKNTELVGYLQRSLLDIAGRIPVIEEGATADTVGLPTRLAVTANDPQVSLPSSILTVEQVRLLSSGLLLTKTETSRLAASARDWTTTTGTPTQYLEPRRGLLRLYPIPLIADELRLIVHRRFIEDTVTWATVATEATPTATWASVPDDLREALIIGACRYAYLKHDADAFNLNLSHDYERQLTDLIGPPVSWRQKEARRINTNLATTIRGVGSRRRVENVEFDEE